jgi:serine/threonine-protein kinase
MSAPSEEDNGLGSTVALPMPDLPSPPKGPRPVPTQALSFGQFPPGPPPGPQPGPNGFGGFPQGGPMPTFAQPQANPALTPAGMVGGVPMHYLPATPSHSAPHAPHAPQGPQSQIETALSLPRPDPNALWLAQQERLKGDRRNTIVLIAVVALTALCVLGIGALVYFKLRARSQSAATPDATAVAAATVTASAAADTSTAAPPSTAAAAPAAAPTPTVATTTAPAAAATPSPGTAQPAAAAKGASGGKEEPGFLTIVCSPNCDDVLDQGKSLGPSPIVHLSVPPGAHRVTLKKGKDSKVVSVTVVSGQVSAQKISMK